MKAPLQPSNVSSDWGDLAERIGAPGVTFHGLRHTHASQLIASGVDIVTISKRLGHAKPSVTLAIYAHMFHTDDSKAANAINAALLYRPIPPGTKPFGGNPGGKLVAHPE